MLAEIGLQTFNLQHRIGLYVMSWTTYDPCPNCGAQNEDTFRQIIRQVENVKLDENGEPEEFVVYGDSFEVVSVACTECDTVILGDEEDFNIV